jgi:hypothetical protein
VLQVSIIFLHKFVFFSYWWYSWETTYESLLGSNKLFSQPIPLGVRSHALLPCTFLWFQDGLKHLYAQEMVDLLVDTWEHEGLYD